ILVVDKVTLRIMGSTFKMSDIVNDEVGVYFYEIKLLKMERKSQSTGVRRYHLNLLPITIIPLIQVKSVKDTYLRELSAIHREIMVTCHQVKNVKLPKKSIDSLQSNKKLVERAIYFLQLHKSSISISHCQKVGYWEKQIPTILTTIGLEKACSSQHLEQQLQSPISHPMQPTNFQAAMTRSPQTSLTSGSSIIGSLSTVDMGSLYQNTVTASLQANHTALLQSKLNVSAFQMNSNSPQHLHQKQQTKQQQLLQLFELEDDTVHVARLPVWLTVQSLVGKRQAEVQLPLGPTNPLLLSVMEPCTCFKEIKLLNIRSTLSNYSIKASASDFHSNSGTLRSMFVFKCVSKQWFLSLLLLSMIEEIFNAIFDPEDTLLFMETTFAFIRRKSDLFKDQFHNVIMDVFKPFMGETDDEFKAFMDSYIRLDTKDDRIYTDSETLEDLTKDGEHDGVLNPILNQCGPFKFIKILLDFIDKKSNLLKPNNAPRVLRLLYIEVDADNIGKFFSVPSFFSFVVRFTSLSWFELFCFVLVRRRKQYLEEQKKVYVKDCSDCGESHISKTGKHCAYCGSPRKYIISDPLNLSSQFDSKQFSSSSFPLINEEIFNNIFNQENPLLSKHTLFPPKEIGRADKFCCIIHIFYEPLPLTRDNVNVHGVKILETVEILMADQEYDIVLNTLLAKRGPLGLFKNLSFLICVVLVPCPTQELLKDPVLTPMDYDEDYNEDYGVPLLEGLAKFSCSKCKKCYYQENYDEDYDEDYGVPLLEGLAKFSCSKCKKCYYKEDFAFCTECGLKNKLITSDPLRERKAVHLGPGDENVSFQEKEDVEVCREVI
ncbi:hypothetical protein GIB67_021542, partial [Kingdonia uniflora]